MNHTIRQPADAPHWTDPRSSLPDAQCLVRVIAHEEGQDYIDMFDAWVTADSSASGEPVWMDECESLYLAHEILVWRDLSESESN